MIGGVYYYVFPQSYRILTTGFSTIFLFFDISALTTATIYGSGIRNKRVLYTSLILFILSMIFLFLFYGGRKRE